MKTAVAVAVAAALFFTACAPATRMIIKPGTKEQPVADPAAATIVVGNISNWKVLNLLDEDGKVVGQLTGRSHTILKRPAGPMKLFAIPEKEGAWGDRVEGTLENGRVYYVKIGMRFGGASVTTLSERTDKEEWPNRKTYIDDLERVNMDAVQIAGLTADLGDPSKLISAVEKVVAGWEPADKTARTFEAADGEK